MASLSSVELVAVGWAVLAVMMALLWVAQRSGANAGLGDVGWAWGLGLLAVLYAVAAGGAFEHRVLTAVVVVVWSARLGLHVFLDRVLGRPEEARYRTWRERLGSRAQLAFFALFQAQAAAAVGMSLPFLVVASYTGSGLTIWEYGGIVVWGVAVLGESTADRQLARWRGDAAHGGLTLRTGLWRYSRHPNYFFEWLHWWAYPVMAVGMPYWWVTFIGPAAMSLFLFAVTGIPVAERQALRSRGDDYRDYQRTTSAFVPWFPKKG
jgi:steroid 5-alpha reductase family enzyme